MGDLVNLCTHYGGKLSQLRIREMMEMKTLADKSASEVEIKEV